MRFKFTINAEFCQFQSLINKIYKRKFFKLIDANYFLCSVVGSKTL